MWHNKLHSEIVSRPDISYFDYCVENLYEKTAIAILFFTALWCRFCVSFRNVTDALSAHNFMDVDKICDEFNEITKKMKLKFPEDSYSFKGVESILEFLIIWWI